MLWREYKERSALDILGTIIKDETENSGLESAFYHLHLLPSYTSEEKQENKTRKRYSVIHSYKTDEMH